jgi:signal transduction histidine kinase
MKGQQPVVPPLVRQSNSNAKAESWLKYSTQIFYDVLQKGKLEGFERVFTASKKGLQITPEEDFNKRAAYHYFLGMAYKVQFSKNDSAIFHFEKSIEAGKLGKNHFYEVTAIQHLNYLYRYLGKFNEVVPNVERLKQLLPLVTDAKVKDVILSALSEHYLTNGNYHRAIALIMESLPLKEKILAERQDYISKVNIGLAYSALGNLYLQLKQNQNALNHFKIAEPYFSDYVGAKLRIYTNMQEVYLNLDQVDSAKICYDKVYQAMADRKVFFESAQLSNTNRIFAAYYLKKENLNLAQKFGALAYQLAIQSESPETIVYALSVYGSLNFQQKKYAQAVNYLEQALPKSYSFSKDVYSDILLKLAQSHEVLGHYKKALNFYKQYNGLLNEIYREKSNEEISKIEFKYKNAQSAKQIKALHQQTVTANELIKQKNQLQVGLMITTVLVILIAFLIYRNYYNKNKANLLLHKANTDLAMLNTQLVAANQTKAQLFSIISHDLRGPVSQLFTFLKFQRAKASVLSDEEKEHHHQKLVESSTNLLETMEDLLLWSKSQMDRFEIEDEELDLSELIGAVVNFVHVQAEAKNISISVEPLGFKNLRGDFNVLQAIFRNLLQNAINYSVNGSEVLIRTQVDHLHQKSISVINYGEVISTEKIGSLTGQTSVKSKSNGYGLTLIQDLVKKINAKLTIQSELATGTAIKIIFQS